MIYLDNSATTRQFDEVTKLMSEIAMNDFGNPSSLHSVGFEAGSRLFDARKMIENTFPDGGRIVFTSGGTESDNMALYSSAKKMKKRGNKIITTNIEHPAVLETCKRLQENGFVIEYLEADIDGFIEPQQLTAALSDNTILVTIMSVNNEVGTIEPVVPCYNIVRDFNKKHGTSILFHTDAVQAFGKMSFDAAPFDLISISGHKIHGPKGIGALYIKNGVTLPAFLTGGGQEGGLRSGTENVPAIAGLGLASQMTHAEIDSKLFKISKVCDYLAKGIADGLDDIIINGIETPGFGLYDYRKRCPSILNISFLGTRGEVILHTIEQEGIFVSTGSACHSKRAGDSHVLKAMSLDHREIEGAIRFSFGEDNTIDEMDMVIDSVRRAVKKFRKLGSYR